MRLEMIRRLQIIVSRQTYALECEAIEYFQELLEDAEECIKAIEKWNNETKMPLIEEERKLLQNIIALDSANRAIINEQFDEIKMKLRNIRMSGNQSAQYMNSYGYNQAAGVFFDKR